MSEVVWTDGIPNNNNFDRYDNSPYYDVPDGWEILAEADWAGDWEFEMIVVWQNTGKGEIRAAYDSGCSCPTPFSGLTMDRAKLIKSPRDLKFFLEHENGIQAVDSDYNYVELEWDGTDPKLADIKMKVARSLADTRRTK